MKLKYCGLTQKKDIETAVSLGVDYVGFVVYPPSARYISWQNLSELLKQSSKKWKESATKTVLVCVDYPAKNLAEWVKRLKIDVVQLHGAENPKYISLLKKYLQADNAKKVEIFKALRLKKETKKEEITPLLQNNDKNIDAFVVEAWHKDYGGAGKSLAKEVVSRVFCAADALGQKVFLSGGIDTKKLPEIKKNFARHTSFFGIDTSSALETKKGQKDIQKMCDFYKIFTENLRKSQAQGKKT